MAMYRIAKHHPETLSALCQSYLCYLEELKGRWPPGREPKRIPRIEKAVKELLAEVRREFINKKSVTHSCCWYTAWCYSTAPGYFMAEGFSTCTRKSNTGMCT